MTCLGLERLDKSEQAQFWLTMKSAFKRISEAKGISRLVSALGSPETGVAVLTAADADMLTLELVSVLKTAVIEFQTGDDRW